MGDFQPILLAQQKNARDVWFAKNFGKLPKLCDLNDFDSEDDRLRDIRQDPNRLKGLYVCMFLHNRVSKLPNASSWAKADSAAANVQKILANLNPKKYGGWIAKDVFWVLAQTWMDNTKNIKEKCWYFLWYSEAPTNKDRADVLEAMKMSEPDMNIKDLEVELSEIINEYVEHFKSLPKK